MKKTAETRARELIKMVYGYRPSEMVTHHLPGWIKLGKFVLGLEAKLAKAKNTTRPAGYRMLELGELIKKGDYAVVLTCCYGLRVEAGETCRYFRKVKR